MTFFEERDALKKAIWIEIEKLLLPIVKWLNKILTRFIKYLRK